MRYIACLLAVLALWSVRAASEADPPKDSVIGADREIECSCQVTDVGEQFWNPAIMDLFNIVDKNHDGRLSAAEWMDLRHKIDEGAAPAAPAKELSFNEKMKLMLEGDGNKVIAGCIKDFDKDHDGKLNDEERTAMLVSLAEQERMLKKFDKNHDGLLSDEERRMAVLEPSEPAFDKMLADADLNHDGILGPGEGMAMLAMIGQKVKDNLSTFMDEFDADRDGKLSEKEMESARIALTTAYQQQEKRMLDRFDTNKDGKLDAKEREAMLDGQKPEVRCICVVKPKAEEPMKPIDNAAKDEKKTSMK
jgi:Ca2+-binding EF-hand superfamily protein